MKIGIIDYGVGNLGSVRRTLQEIGLEPALISRATDVAAPDALILPGVGNFSDCAQKLRDGGWVHALEDQVQGRQKPLLGICVGMQLLADLGREGAAPDMDATPGLGFIPGSVEHIRSVGCPLRVPHVGWNEVIPVDTSDGLFAGIEAGTDFYFVHSYTFVASEPSDILATVDYGVDLCAAVGRGHVWGTQFHPEKSSRAGFRLLRNFVERCAC